MFGLDDIFNDVKSSYSSVGDFFSALGGADLFGGGDSEDKGSSSGNRPSGVMSMDDDELLTNMSDSGTMKLLERLTTSSTKQRRDIRQSKLDSGPSSVSYKDMEAMWMRRLNSIAQGQVLTMESK